MLKLSKENFLKAKSFIFEHGEEIDRSVFQYHDSCSSGADEALSAVIIC